MIGKTNSIVVVGGGDTPATTDRYKGLRPSYWPTVRMPSEIDGNFADIVLLAPISLNPSKKEGVTFTANVTATNTTTINWGDGTSSVPESSLVTTSHTYTINVADYNEKAQGWLYLMKFDNGSYGKIEFPNDIKVLEVSERGGYRFSSNQGDIQFYSTANYWGDNEVGVNLKSLNSLILLPEFTIRNASTQSLDFSATQLRYLPDLTQDIANITMPKKYYNADYNPNFLNHITESITFDNFVSYPSVSFLPQNITIKTIGDSWTGLNIEDLSNYTYTYKINYAYSPFSDSMVKSPSVIISSGTDGRRIFYNKPGLYEATVDPTNANDSSSQYLYYAFQGCYALTYVHMPENSVKRQINLRYLSCSNTDTEPRDSSMTVSQYAWTEIAKALYNHSGAAPSYTPTITISSAASTFLDTLTIDGTAVKEYITNKGWTISEA